MAEPSIWYEESADDEFDFETDWKIAIDANTEPGGGLALTVGSQDAILCGYIPANKLRSAARYFLGFSYADDGDPYKLYREPPAAHPQMPNLRCHGFSVAGDIVQSNTENDDGAPNIVSPFQGPLGEEMRYTKYNRLLATVRFKSFGRMRFLLDDQIETAADEIKRYTRSYTESATQTLSVDGMSMLKFAEGPPSLTTPPQPFPAPLAQLLARSSIRVTWYYVPNNYISSSSNFLQADQLLARLGTINEDTFLGNLPGTLLFNAFQAEEVLFPVLSNEPLTTALTGWNITMCFEQFDPPKGVPGSEYRGHRIYPYRVDGKWYYCTRSNSSDELLPLTEFAGIVKHWNAP
jgi:hypothetical protein